MFKRKLAAIMIALKKSGKFARHVVTPRKTTRTIKRTMKHTYGRGMDQIGNVDVTGSRKQVVSRVHQIQDETAAKIRGLGDYGRRLTTTRRAVGGGLVALGAAATAAPIAAKISRDRKRKQPYIPAADDAAGAAKWWKDNPQGSRWRETRPDLIGSPVQRLNQYNLKKMNKWDAIEDKWARSDAKMTKIKGSPGPKKLIAKWARADKKNKKK